MDERVYWMWVQNAFGAGSPLPMKIAGQYAGGLREFHEGGPKLWNNRRDLKDSEAAALWEFTIGETEARLEYAEKLGWQVLIPGGPGYPKLLLEIPNPPAALYVKGKMPDLDERVAVAVVGSRKPLTGSAGAAWGFGNRLAMSKVCVVSGGAEGVDKEALKGALHAPGSSLISVLPVSLDSSYIQRNAKLRSVICARGGALVSEYFFQRTPGFGTFQMRNRLITGMCRGVVIVQAGEKSGSMIYATHALDQNRDVFVYPGPEGSPQFAGSRQLIADGARAVKEPEEILDEYGIGALTPTPEPQVEEFFRELDLSPVEEEPRSVLQLKDVGEGLSLAARGVLEALEREPQTVAQLAEKTGMAPAALLGTLTQLEIEGLARSFPGKRYALG